MPEQLGSYNDVVAGSACKLLVLLSFWVAFVVLDEVDNGVRQLVSSVRTCCTMAGNKSSFVGGSSSIFTVGLLSALTNTPGGTMDRLDPSLDRMSAATLSSLGTWWNSRP